MDFQDWKEFYGWGFCTQAQLQQAVQYGMLTEQQYDEIVGVSTNSDTTPENNVSNTTNPTQTVANSNVK